MKYRVVHTQGYTGWLSRLREARAALACLLCAGLLVSEPVAAERYFYRYKNAEGGTVQTDRLPAGAAARGYQVLSARGSVIKVVPRQLSEQERQQRDVELQAQRQRDMEQTRRRQRDQALMLRYSSIAEIDEAKLRGLKEFKNRLGIWRGNQMSLKGRIETEQSDAANFHRRGREAPDGYAERITSLKVELLDAENTILALNRERNETEQQYEQDKARFLQLRGQAGASH